MLAVPADRIPAALADLDPGNRALLDLSLRRGVSDGEIGELLRKDPDDVARGRDAVLGLLADSLGIEGDDRRERVRRAISELPDEAWRAAPSAPPAEPEPERTEGTVPPARSSSPSAFGAPPRETEGPGPSVSKPEPPTRPREEAPFAKPPAERRRGRGRWLAVLGVLAVVLALLALLLGGDDSDQSGDPSPTTDQPRDTAPPRADAGRRVALEPFGGGEGSGRIEATGDGGYVISLRGLPKPDGTYQAWLYNDVTDAIPLGTFREGAGQLPLRLPARSRGYRFLDVSLEPADSNRNHSGDSVLRAPLDDLLE